MDQTIDMTTGSPVKHLLTFTLPLWLTNIGQQLYMITDASIVGRGVGVSALASVGSCDWIYWMVLWIIMGLTQGFATFISRYFGMKDYAKTNKVIAMSALLCGVIGVFLTICGLLLANPLLKLLKTPQDIIDGAASYLLTMLSGTLCVMAYNMAAAVLRAFGNSRHPLYAMLIAATVNIVLDILFIFGFNWGITGAAAASVLAQLISFFYCLAQIRKITIISLPREIWKADFDMLTELFKFGLPVALLYVFIAASGIVVQYAINLQGSVFVAGFTATNKIYGLMECTAISLGVAIATFCSQNYGAKNYKRFKEGVLKGFLLTELMALVITFLVLLPGKYLLKLFIAPGSSYGSSALQVAELYLFISGIFLVILFPIHTYRNGLNALGDSFWPMVSGAAECVARSVTAIFLVNLFGRELLFYTEPAAWIAALAFSVIPYYCYQQKRLAEKI
ncbi:MAG: MATE family efflux transporter [Lentisphaeria bacterium]|nr:MATE family efflux transporter [Lentisphaeria bacterium]